MKKLFVLALGLLATAHACAVDGIYVERGEGDETELVRLGALWKWDRTWRSQGGWQLTGAWEAAIGGMRGEKPSGNDQIVGDIGITPVFRWAPVDGTGLAPYLEGGFLGVHLISRAFVYNGRKFGSSFQFGHHVGFGVNFGERREFGLGYRFHHMSNGGLVEPNQGINFSEIHLVYYF